MKEDRIVCFSAVRAANKRQEFSPASQARLVLGWKMKPIMLRILALSQTIGASAMHDHTGASDHTDTG